MEKLRFDGAKVSVPGLQDLMLITFERVLRTEINCITRIDDYIGFFWQIKIQLAWLDTFFSFTYSLYIQLLIEKAMIAIQRLKDSHEQNRDCTASHHPVPILSEGKLQG